MASGKQLKLTDISVDDLFKDHSIHYVRGLHNEYKASVKNAKDELHSLVGQKYRDLIRIAEDIDGMSNMSKTINQQIGELSYSPSKHVAFGQNNHSRFNSMVRSRRSQNARIQSQNTILNNIINNKLIGFDLKIKTKALNSSPYLIYMAQVYHTVSSVFNQSISSSPSSNQTLSTLKQNFISFLERRLAQITTTDASGNYLRDNLKSASGSQWIEGDDVEFLADSYEDEMVDNNSDSEQADVYKTSHHNSDPIFNYLAAYLIMSSDNSELQSMCSIAQKIVSLRLEYIEKQLESCISQAPSFASNISFSSLLNFIQSTQTYLKEYFTSSDTNELVSFLSSISIWKATEYIGFHNWFTNHEVKFDIARYTSFSSEKASHDKHLGNFEVLLKKYFKKILALETSDDEIFLCHRAMSLFYNFVCSARKSEVLAEWNGSSSVVKEFCRNSNLISSVFQLTLSYVESITMNHQKSLSDVLLSEQSILYEAKKDRLFSQEFVSSIDEDVTDYYRKVLDFSSFNDTLSGSEGHSDAASRLKHWFNAENDLLETSSSLTSPLIEKTLNTLQKSYRNSIDFGSWGDFNVESFKSKISETRKTLVSNLLSIIESCVTSVTSKIQQAVEDNEEGNVFLWLHLSSILVSNLEIIPGADDLKSNLKAGIVKIFVKMFNNLQTFKTSETVVFDLLFKPETMTPGFESATLPVKPHLIVYSAMQRLSSSLLQSPIYSQDELLELYSSSATKADFVRTKNEWISKTLIQGGLQSLNKSLSNGDLRVEKASGAASSAVSEDESKSNMETEAADSTEVTTEGSVDDTPKDTEVTTEKKTEDLVQTPKGGLSTEQSRQLLANIVFLICFTSDEEITTNNSLLTDAVSKINEMSEEAIEGSALSIITRGVSKNYLFSKEIYLPLSFN